MPLTFLAGAPPRAAGPGLEASAEDRHALADAGQPAPAAAGRTCAAAVVGDLDLDAVVAVADDRSHLRSAGVLGGVCEPFLDDPVGGELERRRKLAPLPLHPQLHTQAGLAHRLDEPLEIRESRLRLA